MNYGSWHIDDYITLLATTSVYATGAAADADSPPTYRIYEADIETAILTGTFTVWSDANTLGFYRARVQLTAANGFERGKTYSIYIETIVSGITSTQQATVQIAAAADIAYVGTDATAAANLKLQYNGTGLTGDSFPATQSQLGNLSTGSAAISTIASAFVKSGAEPETGSYLDTFALDEIYHIVEDVGNLTEFYYQFTLPGNGVPTTCLWNGYANGVGDSYDINAWNWQTSAWQQIDTITAVNGTTRREELWQLLTAHVGTGANIGLVRIQVTSADGSAFATDRILCSYSVIGSSVGYANGTIWIDTLLGVAGVEPFVNGIADNPSSNLTDALALSVATTLRQFSIVSGSTINLIADASGMVGYGENWNLGLAGQLITGATVYGANVTGDADAASIASEFNDCHFGASVGLTPCTARACGMQGTITLLASGSYIFDACYSEVAGTDTPVIDRGVAVGAIALNLRHVSSGIELENLVAGDNVSLEGHGQLVINANCSGGTIAIRGHFPISGDAAAIASITFVDSARIDQDQILKAIASDTTKIAGAQLNAHTAITPGSAADLAALTVDVAATQTDLDTLTDSYGEPGTEAFPVSATPNYKIAALYKHMRNKKDQDDTTKQLYNDDGTTVGQQATVSEVAGVVTVGEMTSG